MKGLLIVVTVILIFITCILNFIVLFPQEQGVTFSGESQSGYLAMSNNSNLGIDSDLNKLSSSSSNAFNTWDITQGFMGSNSMKQGQTGVGNPISQTFSSLTIMATQLFKSGSPILYVIGIFSTLAGIIIVYQIYKFIRTGN